jgi:hypothetical protein
MGRLTALTGEHMTTITNQCTKCGGPFLGTPWRYNATGREHVDCAEPSPFRNANGYAKVPPPARELTFTINPGKRTRRKWGSNPFKAKFNGTCGLCGGRIALGQRIARRDGTEPTYAHYPTCHTPEAAGALYRPPQPAKRKRRHR